MKTLLLSQKEAMSLITMKDVVEIVEKNFRGMGEGNVINPTKVNLDLGETNPYPPYAGYMNAMPAYIGWENVAGIKWAGGALGKRKALGLPYISSMMFLVDPVTLQFKSVMDSAMITNYRTGAQSAVAMKYLTKKRDITFGLYGAGMQARTQVMAFAEIFTLNKIKVYDVYTPAAEKFKKDVAQYVKNGNIEICSAPRDVVEDCDAIVAVTQAQKPIVEDHWIRSKQVFFPMGSWQECTDEFILNADKIVVDHIGQCLHRGALRHVVSEGKFSEKDIYCTIGELVAGKKKLAYVEDRPAERTICIPIGTGAQDVAVGGVIYQRAIAKGVGSSFQFV
ncbi:MAG: ornithine cyclodeaminase family protein [Pyramidobacter sp.]|uniref:ornithine cyclodeaminase family protein n=1 Tax=Pyramidobacter sp. TaxID=1943581 RepID=UPI002A8147EB|nr:ornithine cyclodeaminase family protein [Pyramidobacter sp.]MDY4033095.1 ornithine cyclodeaminase family protein [Pyramidobacter sp.]